MPTLYTVPRAQHRPTPSISRYKGAMRTERKVRYRSKFRPSNIDLTHREEIEIEFLGYE